MRLARGLVLIIAAGSAIGAAALVRRTVEAPPPRVEQPAAPEVEILVVRRPVAAGEKVSEADLSWQRWTADVLPANAVSRRRGSKGERFLPALARYPLLEGEPMVEAKLIRPGEGSLAAALIAPGMRASAIPLKEESAAGGLIQPGDRVDVIWTRQRSEGRPQRLMAHTILTSVKVLAIGKSIHAGQKNADGRTATLELTPEQARSIESAKASGELSLALIPAGDVAALGGIGAGEPLSADTEPSVRIMKFGRQPAGVTDGGGSR